jgi:uncharacterized membrane protein
MKLINAFFSGIGNFIGSVFSAIVNFIGSVFSAIVNFFRGFSKSYMPNFFGISNIIVPVALLFLVFMNGFGQFGIDSLSPDAKNMLLIKIAVLCVIVFLIIQVAMPMLLKSIYNESNWKASSQWRQALMYHTALIVGSLSLIASATGHGFDFIHATLFLVLILLVTAIHISVKRGMIDTKNTAKAQEITANLGRKKHQSPAVSMQILNFKDGINNLSIVPNQLIYADSNGNYTTFLTQTMMGVEKKTLTISAKEVSKELNGYTQFTQFNNNLIVNELAIKAVRGHAGGFELELAKIADKISVGSRFVKNLDSL